MTNQSSRLFFARCCSSSAVMDASCFKELNKSAGTSDDDACQHTDRFQIPNFLSIPMTKQKKKNDRCGKLEAHCKNGTKFRETVETALFFIYDSMPIWRFRVIVCPCSPELCRLMLHFVHWNFFGSVEKLCHQRSIPRPQSDECSDITPNNRFSFE